MIKMDFCLRVEEYWDPQQEGLEQIVATRKIPSIHILLSLDEIDPKTPGYQHSKTRTTFWMEGDSETKNGEHRKNYFTGPGLKKRPNKLFTDSKYTGDNGSGNSGVNGGDSNNRGKNKNKPKTGKPGHGETRDKQSKKQPSGESAPRNSKKARNSEGKPKANVADKSASSGQSEMA